MMMLNIIQRVGQMYSMSESLVVCLMSMVTKKVFNFYIPAAIDKIERNLACSLNLSAVSRALVQFLDGFLGESQ